MKAMVKTFLVTVVIIAAYFLFSSLRGGTGTNIQFDADTIKLSAPERFTCSIPYKDIIEVKLVESWSEIKWVTLGRENRRYVWDFVRYGDNKTGVLCLTKKIDNAILITDTDGTQVLFNYENEDTTQRIFDMLPDLINAQTT